MSEIAHKSVAAAKWGLLSSVGKFGLQLAVNIVIARLLGPEPYGLYALAAVALLIATFMSEVGLGWNLIQRAEVDAHVIRFVHTWQAMSGLGGFLLMLFGAELMASFLHEPRVAPVMRWLGLICLFNGLAGTATNLLRRELRFKDLAKIQLSSYALAYGVIGLPLALLGAGVWALVAANVAQALLNLLQSNFKRRHPWLPQWRTVRPREFFDVGAAVLATNLCNWALTNLDRLLLGRVGGAQAAGLYAVGYNLATVPNGLLISALQPAFLASGARLQGDLPRLGQGYFEVQSFIWVVLAPLFAVLAWVGVPVIAMLYGPRWQASGPIFQMLALAMPFYLAWALSTPVLWNTGRKWWELGLQLPLLCAAAPVLYWAAQQGAAQVAGVAAALFAARALCMMGLALRALPVPLRAWAGTLGRAAGVLGAVLLPALVLAQWPALQSVAPWLQASTQALASLAVWAALLLAWPNGLGPGAVGLLQRFVPRQRAWGQAWARRAHQIQPAPHEA